jgi:predicted amidohydrolase
MGTIERFRVAAGQPVGGPDVRASVYSHAAVVRAAGTDVVVFPEISSTG